MPVTRPATIGTIELHDLLKSPAPPRMIDVRTPGEFETAHIPGSYNVPLSLLRERRDEIARQLAHDVVLICRSGQRASQAEGTLRTAGMANLHVLDGGMTGWESADLAVNRGTERWAIERQVRLVAGSVVLASVIASIGAPKLKWLAAGIGGGLTFAAVSNTCAMGLLLAKLPYNRGPVSDPGTLVAKLVGDSAARTPCSR